MLLSPEDTARQIARRTDPNEWICAFFDWEEGSTVINPEELHFGVPRLIEARHHVAVTLIAGLVADDRRLLRLGVATQQQSARKGESDKETGSAHGCLPEKSRANVPPLVTRVGSWLSADNGTFPWLMSNKLLIVDIGSRY